MANFSTVGCSTGKSAGFGFVEDDAVEKPQNSLACFSTIGDASVKLADGFDQLMRFLSRVVCVNQGERVVRCPR